MPGLIVLAVLLIAGLRVHLLDVQAQTGPQQLRQGVPADRAPWLGTWQLVQPAAGRFESPPYKKVTIRIEPWQDGIAVSYDMVRTRGGISHMEWTGRFDGRDYPVQGVDYVLTNAYRLIDDRSYEITSRPTERH
jgi:hypothetical protein